MENRGNVQLVVLVPMEPNPNFPQFGLAFLTGLDRPLTLFRSGNGPFFLSLIGWVTCLD